MFIAPLGPQKRDQEWKDTVDALFIEDEPEDPVEYYQAVQESDEI